MAVSDKNENIDNIQNESEDSDNQDHLDQYPGVDIVEDFARQLDELCMNAPHLQDDEDDDEDGDIPFGYEQLPQDEEGFGALNSDDDYNNEEEEENINKKDTMLENSDIIMNEIEQQQQTIDPSTLKSFTIAVDTSEKLPTETSDLIMNIMKNIDLPDHAIPLWAKNIPESKWMPKLKENNK
ncbi:hypothetical protein BJ944DRAFT_243244 [Cunninghamella echinulata]|nr:hypothetical protein BJ944DRAFT_243244 [Cunninghamella echinulata]